MTASKIYILLYGHGYPGLRSGKSGLLEMKERKAATSTFFLKVNFLASCFRKIAALALLD